MYKKIIIFFFFYLVFLNISYAAKYTSALPEDDIHKVYEESLVNTVSEYIENNPWKINIDDLTDLVIIDIASNWGWSSDYDEATKIGRAVIEERNWVRLEWNFLIVWCWNDEFWKFELDPIKPKKTTSYWWTCSSYIKSWSPVRWNCIINSNWTSDWKINCQQSTIGWSSNSKSCWRKIYNTTETCDHEWNCTTTKTSSCSRTSCPNNAWRPSSANKETTLNINFSPSKNTCKDLYANNNDDCSLTFDISSSLSKPIVWLSWKIIKNIEDNSGIKSNRIDNNWGNALNFENINNTEIKWGWYYPYFEIKNIKSSSPFTSNNWEIKFDIEWKDSFTTIYIDSIDYSFLKPYSWNLEVFPWELNIWTQQTLQLNINNCIWCTDRDYTVWNFADSLDAEWENIIVQNILNEKNLSDTPQVDFRLNFSGEDNIDEDSNLSIKPYINYNIDWNNIKYYLWNEKISLQTEDFLWAKVIWTKELNWKFTITWQEDNFSDLSKFEIKGEIKKNAFNLIKKMENNETSNSVKYVEWNYEIKASDDFETIVIKNWNLTIWENIDNQIWIIVLNEEFDSDWMPKNWNIYIKPNVTYIKAISYADWWVMSIDSSGNTMLDSSSRTQTLQKQLVYKWSIFSKNTIGWAILTWWEYILPWEEKTYNFDKAMNYDLNYLRRWTEWNNPYNLWNTKNPFIIIYDPSIQSNPPKWFN